MNKRNHRLRDTETTRNIALPDAAAQVADFGHLFTGKLCARISLPQLGSTVCSGAALRRHVSHVLLMRAEPKVVRIHARGIVTAMQDKKASGNWAFGAFVGDTVRSRYPRALTEATIASLLVPAPGPLPATARFPFYESVKIAHRQTFGTR